MVTVRAAFTVCWDAPGVSLGMVTVWVEGMVRVGLGGYNPSRMLAAWVLLFAPSIGRARIRVRRKVEIPRVAMLASLVAWLPLIVLACRLRLYARTMLGSFVRLFFRRKVFSGAVLLFPPPRWSFYLGLRC